jgi:hypothetical protein
MPPAANFLQKVRSKMFKRRFAQEKERLQNQCFTAICLSAIKTIRNPTNQISAFFAR